MEARESEPEGEPQTQGRTPLVGKAQARGLRCAQCFGEARPWSGDPVMRRRMGRWCRGRRSALFLPVETGAARSRQV